MLKNDNQEENILKFPEGFLWGASTSAYQIEGGITCDWSQWEMSDKRLRELRSKKLNYRDFVCGRACDSYNRYSEDIALAKNMNLGGFRLGIEWARIEPKEGEFNHKEIEHYRRVLTELKNNNIKVVLTLWHWTNPMWVVSEGGWSNKKVVGHFARYVEFVAAELGDLVDFWVTINEPTVHVLNGYFKGTFPPNKMNPILGIKTFFNLVSAHRKAYEVIHKTNLRANVGFTHLGDNFQAARPWFFLEVFLAWIFNFFCNQLFLRLICSHIDYIGLDYYFHNRVVWHPPFIKNINKEVTDFGWEIYPEGIYNILKDLRRFKKPIYIMENGLADAADAKREKFIIDHLRYVHKAIEEGEDVRGYFHWSLLDNFEWAAGWGMKFGFYEVDRETFERKPRPSVRTYAEICLNNGVLKEEE
jgi:beta-glucosidase